MSTAVFDLDRAALSHDGTLAVPATAHRAPAADTKVTEADAWTIDVTTTRAGFDALEADWTSLFDRVGRGEHMFLTFNWLWHWCNHYLAPADELAIVTVRIEGRLVAALPLVIERVTGLRQLAFMGAPISQYADALIEPGLDQRQVFDTAFREVTRTRRIDLVRFAKVRADANLAPFLAAAGFRVTAREEAPAATMAGLADYAAFETRFSAKLRKNRQRQRRRLEERGPLDIAVHEGTAAARDAVALAMTLKRAWLNARGFYSKAFADRRIDAFFADAAASVDRPCGVSVSRLDTNGEGADVNISITCKDRRAVHILAYALKFDKLGAGNHHLDVNLRRAFDSGIAVYDFLAPHHAYKMEWADHVVAVEDHVLAVTPLGRLYADLYVARLREGLKRLMRRLPPSLVRLVAKPRAAE